jgi:hypothetical protein
LREELKRRDLEFADAQDRFNAQVREIQDRQEVKQQLMVEELEGLKMQIKDELIAKTSQIDGEYEELQKEKDRLR